MIESELKVKVGDADVKASNSPTTTLLKHIIDALYSGTNLNEITKIVLVDNNNVERDYTTSLTFTSDSTLTVKGTITCTASYTVTKVRTYSGSNLYFETSVNFSVSVGVSVEITVTITLNFTGSIPAGAVYLRNLRTFFYNVLRNAAEASVLNITSVIFRIVNLETYEIYDIPVTPVKTRVSDTQMTLTASYTPNYDWGLYSVKVAAGSAELYEYSTFADGGRGVKVTYTDTITSSG